VNSNPRCHQLQPDKASSVVGCKKEEKKRDLFKREINSLFIFLKNKQKEISFLISEAGPIKSDLF
jgi:hypothetical protein